MSHQNDAHIEQMPMQLQTAQKTLTATLASHRKSNFAMAVAILQGLTALNAFAAKERAAVTPKSRPKRQARCSALSASPATTRIALRRQRSRASRPRD